jgi:antitoxin VapB
MSLNIKNPKAHELAERVARLSGETLTEAVTTALRERLARLEQVEGSDEALYRKLKAIAADCRKHMREPWLSLDQATCSTTNEACRSDRRLLRSDCGRPRRTRRRAIFSV